MHKKVIIIIALSFITIISSLVVYYSINEIIAKSYIYGSLWTLDGLILILTFSSLITLSCPILAILIGLNKLKIKL